MRGMRALDAISDAAAPRDWADLDPALCLNTFPVDTYIIKGDGREKNYPPPPIRSRYIYPDRMPPGTVVAVRSKCKLMYCVIRLALL